MWMGIIHLYVSTVGIFPDYFFGFATVQMGWDNPPVPISRLFLWVR